MAPNKRKILEAARKYAQKGQKDRALKEYDKLLKLDPRDAKLRLEIGDAHRRWGQVDEAILAYGRVAEQYMAEGFDARAVAVFKQIQNLDPERYEAYVPLAELYERMGLTSEAIQSLQTAADGFHKGGKKLEALELLRRMAALDPSNTTSRIKVADLLRQEGLTNEAVTEYEAAHAELERQGERDAAGGVLERILEAEPERLSSIVSLAHNLLKRGESDAAESMARRALEADDQEPGHYELLADVYRAQQRDEELKDTYKRLADLYRQRGDEDRARDIIQRFVPMGEFGPGLNENSQPNDLDTGLVGGNLDLAQADDPAAPVAEAPSDGLGEELLEDEILMDQPVEPASEAPPAEETVLELEEEPEPEILLDTPPDARQLDDEPAPPPVEGDPDQLLAEASVYLRYGKREQAIRNLEAVVEREPKHRSALEKLGEAYAEDGESASAVQTWLRAAEQAREAGDTDGLAVLRDRIAALDESAAAGLGAAESEPVQAEAPEPVEDVVDLIDLDADVEAPLVESSPDVADDIDFEDEIDIDLDGDELDEDPLPVEEDSLPADETSLPDEFSAEPLDEAAAASAESSAAPSDRVEVERPAAAEVSSSEQIQEELEEAEFYRQQGLTDEARAIYQRVLEAVPNHPLALVRMGEMDASAGGDPDISSSGTHTPALEADADAQGDAATEGAEDIGRDLAEWSEDDLGAEIELDDADDVVLPVSEDELLEADAPEVPGDTAPELDLNLDEPSDTGPLLEEDEPLLEADESGDTTDVEVPPSAEVVAPAPPAEAIAAPAMLAEAQPAPVVFAEAADGAGFDLAAELSDALDDGPETSSGSLSGVDDDGFSAVFREFKKGVSKTLGEGDQEAHWDLGIAYREMGLLDDAIGEFEVALTTPARRIDGLHMVAVCCLDMGRGSDAVGHLEEALGSEGLLDQQRLALRFDLGRAYEAEARIADARQAWEAVAEVDAGFCEVGERLASLGENKPDPDPAQDFESFDDLMGDDEDDDATTADTAEGESFEDLIAEADEVPEEVASAVPAVEPAAHEAVASAQAPEPKADPGDTISDAPADAGAAGSDDPGDSGAADRGDSAATGSGASGSGARGKKRRKKKISFV